MVTDNARKAATPKTGWIDISYPLSDDMVHWPNDNLPPHIDWILDKAKGSLAYMLQLNINSHVGTHINAPCHFMAEHIPNRLSIDEMPLDTFIGPARVIEIKSKVSIEPQELQPYNIQAGERILFKTINSSYYIKGKFIPDYVYVSQAAANFLVDKKVKAIGMDYLTTGGPFKEIQNEAVDQVHITLLGHGIWLLETIDLSKVEAGQYEIYCLPIRVKGSDAAPARAALRPL
jgi:arylformamidase